MTSKEAVRWMLLMKKFVLRTLSIVLLAFSILLTLVVPNVSPTPTNAIAWIALFYVVSFLLWIESYRKD